MLRKRTPQRDDGVIYHLVETQLIPLARYSMPDIKLNRSVLRKRLRSCTTYVYSAAGQRAIAFISIRVNRERLSVEMLAVEPRYQSQGVGRRLMAYAERMAASKGLPEVTLWVDEVNGKGQRFYERLGYTPIYYDHHMKCYLLMKRIKETSSAL